MQEFHLHSLRLVNHQGVSQFSVHRLTLRLPPKNWTKPWRSQVGRVVFQIMNDNSRFKA